MGNELLNRDEYWNTYYSAKEVPQLPSQFATFILNECSDADFFLDVGCGNGRDTFFFARHGMPVVSVDYSTSAIEQITQIANTTGLPISAVASTCNDPALLQTVTSAMSKGNVSGNGVIYARFFIHAITDEEQAGFLDFCAEFLKKNGGKMAFEFRTAMDEKLFKVTEAHYRRYIEPVDFLKELFKRNLSVSYLVQGIGYAKYKHDDAYVVRMIIEENKT